MALIDLTNQKFGRLLVLYRDIETEKIKKDRHAIWHCKCDCGNEVSVVGKDLRSGKTKSCGCLQKERTSQANTKNLIGKRYGKLVVIKQAPSKKHRSYWECLCDCGKTTIKCERDLARGDTNSCGCIYSKGETKISQILTLLGVDFQQQYIFSDFKTENNNFYRFDFAILKNDKVQCLIEYDGIQHFIATDMGWNTKEHLQKTQNVDKLKNEYCQKNSIPLIRISYIDFEKIDEFYLLERIKDVCTVDIL